MPMATSATIIQMNTAKAETNEAMARVIKAVRYGNPVDPEDLVVIRGSSELFAGLGEDYL